MGADKLDTIRKLLAKAEGAATAPEAETYTAKAVAMMARHGIDEALLADRAPVRDELGTSRIPVADPYSACKARLLAWTVTALRCRAVLHESGGGRVAAVTVVCYASDRARAELLYTSLLVQAGTLLSGVRPPPGESVAAHRRSWLHGFAVRVHQRLVGAEARAQDEARAAAGAAATRSAGGAAADVRSVALVLADRADRVDQAYTAAFPQLGRARRPGLSGSGYAAGDRAGARADLGRTSVRTGVRQALDA